MLYMKKTLDGHKYASAYTILDRDGVTLISYTTAVCHIDSEGFLTCSGLYSRTTIKHIGWFMREYVPHIAGGYVMAKEAYLHNYAINIFTGEVKHLNDEKTGIA